MCKKNALLITVVGIALVSIGCGSTRIYERDIVYRDSPTVVYTPAPAPAPTPVPAYQPTGYFDRWGNWHPYGYYDAWGNWHAYPPPTR